MSQSNCAVHKLLDCLQQPSGPRVVTIAWCMDRVGEEAETEPGALSAKSHSPSDGSGFMIAVEKGGGGGGMVTSDDNHNSRSEGHCLPDRF